MKDTKLLALIEASQMADLKAEARRRGVSLAEIVRRALTAYLSAQQRVVARRATDARLGLKMNLMAAPTTTPKPEIETPKAPADV
jgi:hypothetical protein